MRKIFISFHFSELKDLVNCLSREIDDNIILNREGLKSFHLNKNLSYAKEPLDNSLDKVSESSYMVVLLGDNLGSKPDGSEKTYIEREIERAKKFDIPILGFLIGYDNIESANTNIKNAIKLCGCTFSPLPKDKDELLAFKIVKNIENEIDESRKKSAKQYSISNQALSVSGITKETYDLLVDTREANVNMRASERADYDLSYVLFILNRVSINCTLDYFHSHAGEILGQLEKIFTITHEKGEKDLFEKIDNEKRFALKSIEAENINEATKHLKRASDIFASDFYTCFWISRIYLYNDSMVKEDIKFANNALDMVKALVKAEKDPFIFAVYSTMKAVALMKLGESFDEVNTYFEKAFKSQIIKETIMFQTLFFFKNLVDNANGKNVACDVVEIKQRLINSLLGLLRHDIGYYILTCENLIKIENNNGYNYINQCLDTEGPIFRDLIREIDERESTSSKKLDKSMDATYKQLHNYIEQSDERGRSNKQNLNVYNSARLFFVYGRSMHYFNVLKSSLHKILSEYENNKQDDLLIENWKDEQTKHIRSLKAKKYEFALNTVSIVLLIVSLTVFFGLSFLLDYDSSIYNSLQNNITLFQSLTPTFLKKFFISINNLGIYFVSLVGVLSISALYFLILARRKNIHNVDTIKAFMQLNNLKLNDFTKKFDELCKIEFSEIFYSCLMQNKSTKIKKTNLDTMELEVDNIFNAVRGKLGDKNQILRKDLNIWGNQVVEFEQYFISLYSGQLGRYICAEEKLKIVEIDKERILCHVFNLINPDKVSVLEKSKVMLVTDGHNRKLSDMEDEKSKMIVYLGENGLTISDCPPWIDPDDLEKFFELRQLQINCDNVK